MPPCRFVTTNIVSTRDSVFFSPQETELPDISENESPLDVKEERTPAASLANFEIVDTLSNGTGFSTASGNEAHKPTHFVNRNEFCKNYSGKIFDKLKDETLEHQDAMASHNIEKPFGSMKTTSNMDHVYEEVSALKEPYLIEYDIVDYYEKYCPTTAKTLINTLFLPRHKICKHCASLQDSPVYTDTLIYSRKPLYAKEVTLYYQDDVLHFKYCSEGDKPSHAFFSQYDYIEPCMLVYNCSKTSASSIFYFPGPPRDNFDLSAELKPDILLVSSSGSAVANTELYHRCVNNFYTRVSGNGNAPMIFYFEHDNVLSSIKHIGYDTDLQNWMNYRNDVFRSRSLKQDEVIEHRANRSSLLLLEPLLLMPDLASPRYRTSKNRISHSEHMKIVRIVIAYTLSFFILAIITFYIVYFT